MLGLALAAGGATAQQPAPTAPAVIDGPTSYISLPAGLATSVARDGTGGVVYLKQVGGATHVFISTLLGGVFSAPVELGGALSQDSSAPVIAAGNGGLVLVAFVSGGELYEVTRASAQSPFSPPAGLASGAMNPAISISNLGKAYLAFTVADGSGDDVRAAYYYNRKWALETAPLNATPADSAGVGAGRPAVATAGDGEGIVVWGEGGSIVSRRVWGTSPSVLAEQADGALPGCTEVGADNPVVGTEGDSSYADVAFHEVLSCGGMQQSRVLVNRLEASAYAGVAGADGLATGSGGAEDPQITMGEYGHGFISSERATTNDVYATALGDNGALLSTFAVNSMTEAAPPDPVVATAGLFSDLVAWQQTPGSAGVPEIRVRYAPVGATLGPEMVVSSPTEGNTDAADGLAATGDVDGDSLVAWVQVSGGAPQIMAARLYQPPGGFNPQRLPAFQRTAHPALSWTVPQEAWGPVTYTVSVDGTQVAQTTATTIAVPAGVSDGPHAWQVVAGNPAGQQSTMHQASVFVDTTPPTASITAPRRVKLGTLLKLVLSYLDPAPPGGSSADASGVHTVLVRWGDGSSTQVTLGIHRLTHLYKRARRYTVIVAVTDAAANSATVSQPVRVFKPKSKRKAATKPPHKGSKPTTGGAHG